MFSRIIDMWTPNRNNNNNKDDIEQIGERQKNSRKTIIVSFVKETLQFLFELQCVSCGKILKKNIVKCDLNSGYGKHREMRAYQITTPERTK